jgi:MSHA pilin protein MshB
MCHMHQRCTDFTFIELTLVIVLIGALSALALPFFSDMSADAHRASVDGTSTAVRVAVQLVHSTYLVNGTTGPDINDNVTDFGDSNINVNTAGYPTDTNDGNSINPARCVRLWEGRLSPAPTILSLATSLSPVTPK